jgi:hypothetical protein
MKDLPRKYSQMCREEKNTLEEYSTQIRDLRSRCESPFGWKFW